MAHILLVGRDSLLLETRGALLRRLPADVDAVMPGEAVSRMQGETYQLLVLCHTLNEARDGALIRTLLDGWPETKVLRLGAPPWMEPLRSIGVREVSGAEPRKLIDAAREMLREGENATDV